MYLTFLSRQGEYQVSFEELLNNPFMRLSELPKTERKHVTVIESEEHCKRLFDTLHFVPKHLVYVPENYDTAEHYTHFERPKKSDPTKMRPIDAPDEELKLMQTIYKNLIENNLHFLTHKAAHAYVKRRSTTTSKKVHQKNESWWYLYIDLKDFFNSINEEFLRRMLNQVYPFPFINKVDFENIIKLSLLNGVLPQGSVLSPTLTNAVMVPIDYDLTEKLHNYKRHHYVYTRYADDICISCKEKFNPQEIINIVKEVFEKHCVPFCIKNEKTKFTSRAGKNFSLGTIINKDNQISLGHEKNKRFRAMLFNFCTTGDEWDLGSVHKMLGLISYFKSIEPDFVKKQLERYNKKFGIDILVKAKNMTR